MVALTQSFCAQFPPHGITVFVALHQEGGFHRSLQVTTCQGQLEARLWFTYKVQRYFGVSALLQVLHQGSSAEVGMSNELHDARVVLRSEGELEVRLRQVELDNLLAGFTIERVHTGTNNACDVQGMLKSANGAYIARFEEILDVMRGSKDKQIAVAAAGPLTRFDAYSVRNCSHRLHIFRHNDDRILANKCTVRTIGRPNGEFHLACIYFTNDPPRPGIKQNHTLIILQQNTSTNTTIKQTGAFRQRNVDAFGCLVIQILNHELAAAIQDAKPIACQKEGLAETMALLSILHIVASTNCHKFVASTLRL
mmetsp:Transcript_20695/g.30801  ORF Transcript_20695/g.30801 Transcript_20695/m.30801 type:complete len:310 (-) Transcript_20695:1294-2223(-)